MLINETDIFTWDEISTRLYERFKIPSHNEPYTVLGEDSNTTEIVVRVIIENIEPFCTIRETKNGTKITGYMADIWNILEESLKFKSEYVQANFEVGKNMLMNGTADVRLVPVIVTTADNEDFDFTLPIAHNWYELFIRSDNDGASSLSYIVTWSDKLWFAFAATCLLLTIMTYTMLYFRFKYQLEKVGSADSHARASADHVPVRPNQQDGHTKNQISLGNCFLNVLGSFTSQGCETPSSSYSIRVVVLVSLFFGLLMNNAYSAVLVSRLATGQKEVLFPTLASVAQSKTHTLCVRTGSFAYVKLKEREMDAQLKPEWRDIVNKPPACLNESTQENIANAICKDGVVVLETPIIMAAILKDQDRSHKCAVMRMAGRNALAVASLFMTKWYPLKQKFNEIIFRMHTSGILDYLQRKWLSRTMPDNKELISSEVRMDHIAGVLLVYFIAILLSCCILAAEVLTKQIRIAPGDSNHTVARITSRLMKNGRTNRNDESTRRTHSEHVSNPDGPDVRKLKTVTFVNNYQAPRFSESSLSCEILSPADNTLLLQHLE